MDDTTPRMQNWIVEIRIVWQTYPVSFFHEKKNGWIKKTTEYRTSIDEALYAVVPMAMGSRATALLFYYSLTSEALKNIPWSIISCNDFSMMVYHSRRDGGYDQSAVMSPVKSTLRPWNDSICMHLRMYQTNPNDLTENKDVEESLLPKEHT